METFYTVNASSCPMWFKGVRSSFGLPDVKLIYMKHYQERVTYESFSWIQCLLIVEKTARYCHSIFVKNVNASTFSAVTAAGNQPHLLCPSNRDRTPTLRNPRNDSCTNRFVLMLLLKLWLLLLLFLLLLLLLFPTTALCIQQFSITSSKGGKK